MKSLNGSSPYLPVPPTILFVMYVSQQSITGQGKLVMVLVQLTFMKQLYASDYNYAKITLHDFEIYFRQST